ncbi:HAD superfamily, subfamily IIIB acid phosphatase [Actinidia rufa]|uniref:HAD superfamily, subfamily IIIB acid phosphatase n=1 Tax=Actinidia rufa TaxID=165716 RepID=A0A7J0G056_9ERIC|nr:HAD superfamily, subfamily IIIB acid phosphatase [Actinidia rufa]
MDVSTPTAPILFKMRLLFPLLLAAVVAAATTGSEEEFLNQIHTLRPRHGAGGTPVQGLSCLSWRLGVEAHNVINWKTVPQECEDYVGHYMLGHQYRKDSETVVNEALVYAQSLHLGGDGKDIWVFDIDETTLSNLPYYANHGFGVEPYNSTQFNVWVDVGEAPALPESLKLYGKLLPLGLKVVFITGRPESQRNVTTNNLRKAGYHTWEKLILKSSDYTSYTAVAYKSIQRKILEKNGYRIAGNMGDQWSDILGTHVGNRTFKLPDPMYYIS